MKETIVTLTGRSHAVICNYKSILRYQQEEIIVLGFHGKDSHPGEKTHDSEIYTGGNADRGDDIRNCGRIIRNRKIIIERQEAAMRDLTGFRKGIVRIRVQGEQTERFLNLCKARKIKISSLDRTGEQSLEGDFGIQDFLRLSPIRRKTGVKIQIGKTWTALLFLPK